MERTFALKAQAFFYDFLLHFPKNKAIKSTELEKQSTVEKLYTRIQNVETTKSIKMAK